MQTSTQIRSLLRPGDRRTVGNVEKVVRTILEDPKLIASLVECTFDVDAGVRMRAADALEKVSRKDAKSIQPHAAVLLGLFEQTEQQELLWHLAVLLPRLHLDAHQRRRAGQALERCMAAKSSIVKTSALQGLADLAKQEPSLIPPTRDLLMTAVRNGTPAMKARSRKLLHKLKESGDNA